jgi:GNAT superfamily N-acetyltransferase
MVWNDMGWPAYGSPRQEDNLEGCLKSPTHVEEYRIEVTGVPEPGPAIEVRDLLRKLYGEPNEVGTQNPYVASYRRLRGSAIPQSGDSQARGHITGTIDYGYWPSLKLGYIENVRVRSEMRRKGLGLKLVDFALDYLRSRGIRRIYSFAVNPEGFTLLESAGFVPEPPESSEYPWRRWFSIT